MTEDERKARKAQQMREYRANPAYKEIERVRDRAYARLKRERKKLNQPMPSEEDRRIAREAMRRHRARPRQDKAAYFRDRLLKQKYGLAFGDLQMMLVAQDYKCAICESRIDEVTRHVDHDHSTEVVRALLCGHCNRGLGQFRDSAELLRNAASYLDKHSDISHDVLKEATRR